MARILIAEDEKNLQLLMKERLKVYYDVYVAEDGVSALSIIDDVKIDLLVTDVMMPDMDGFQLIRTLRKEGYTLPVLILTAKQSFQDKKTGFTIGTDDYMTKPVNFEELHWRINALLRRAAITSERKIQIGEVVLDENSYSIYNSDKQIELPKKEFELLYKLLSYPNMIFTKAQLLDDIWGYDSESGEETVKTHISRLRRKVEEFTEFEIITVKGLGYKCVLKD
ncbi:MAG: response regulator transcription factor [Ruminococcus sp.]|nr:response regulator transcription factor [Ruminococcus sp.]